jgi:hypothetical protein
VYYFLTRKGDSKVEKKELTQSVRSAIPLASAASSIWAAANPSEVAVVESISGNFSGLELMDYLHLGQVIRLNNRETLVLSYKASCVRETITGGTVTVGLDRSQVQSGEVQRSVGGCGEGKPELTGAQSIAGRTFRGGFPH